MKSILTSLLLCSVLTAAAQDPVYPPASPVTTAIAAAEYYIDTDPGFGNGVAIITGTGVDLPAIVASINTTGLSNGVHRLALRTRSVEGIWSLTLVQEFLVDFDPSYTASPPAISNIVAGEYFIDTDPGFGNGIAVVTGSGQQLADVIASINTTGLITGEHYVGIRTKNADGNWSLTNVHKFLVDDDFAYPPAPAAPGAITYAEYFFDTDPGFGNGTSITITPGTDLSNINFTANTTTLADGMHTLFIRSKNDWSITNYTSFLKGTPLPLDFIFFTAVASGNDALLNWQTENEINTSHFDIEWSRDGRNFVKIGEERSLNTPGTHHYRYVHLSPGEGRSYYRLKQVDQDNLFKYSNTAIINIDNLQRPLLYPNPASDLITLKNVNVSGIAALQITDAQGRLVMQVNTLTGLQYDISKLASGNYRLTIFKKDGTSENIPFVKLGK